MYSKYVISCSSSKQFLKSSVPKTFPESIRRQPSVGTILRKTLLWSRKPSTKPKTPTILLLPIDPKQELLSLSRQPTHKRTNLHPIWAYRCVGGCVISTFLSQTHKKGRHRWRERESEWETRVCIPFGGRLCGRGFFNKQPSKAPANFRLKNRSKSSPKCCKFLSKVALHITPSFGPTLVAPGPSRAPNSRPKRTKWPNLLVPKEKTAHAKHWI